MKLKPIKTIGTTIKYTLSGVVFKEFLQLVKFVEINNKYPASIEGVFEYVVVEKDYATTKL